MSDDFLNRGEYGQAEAYCQQGLALVRELGYRGRLAYLLRILARIAYARGDFAQAAAFHQDGLAQAEAMNQRELTGEMLLGLGPVATRQGAYEQAEITLQAALASARERVIPHPAGETLCALGDLALTRARIFDASAYFQELRRSPFVVNQKAQARTDFGRARVAEMQGRVADARRLGAASLARLEGLGPSTAAEVRTWLESLAQA